jgi:hypothetical protein
MSIFQIENKSAESTGYIFYDKGVHDWKWLLLYTAT